MRKQLIEAIIAVAVEEAVRNFVAPLLPYVWLGILLTLSWELAEWKAIKDRAIKAYRKLGVQHKMPSYLMVAVLGAGLACLYWWGVQKTLTLLARNQHANESKTVLGTKQTPIVTLQLLPAVDEEHATSIPVTGALVIFANNTEKALKNFRKLMLLPPIKEATIPEIHSQRLEIIAGNKKDSEFLDIEAPELLPGEHHYVRVTFLLPQEFTSSDMWGRQYGYTGEDVMVYRVFISPETKKGSEAKR